MTKNLAEKLFNRFGSSISNGGIVYDVERRMSRYDVHTVSVENPEEETTGWTQVMVRYRKERIANGRESRSKKVIVG
jgi:hypothetical protein